MLGNRKDEFVRVAFAHFRELRRVALRICEDRETADDLVQETYLRAWRSFDRFMLGTNCRAWLYRILFNVHSEHRRTQARKPVVLSLHRVKETALSSETRTPPDLTLEEVKVAFAELAEPYRVVLVLADVEGMRYREIADVLGVPIGTVMSRLSRGRQILRARLAAALSKPGEDGSFQKVEKNGRF